MAYSVYSNQMLDIRNIGLFLEAAGKALQKCTGKIPVSSEINVERVQLDDVPQQDAKLFLDLDSWLKTLEFEITGHDGSKTRFLNAMIRKMRMEFVLLPVFRNDIGHLFWEHQRKQEPDTPIIREGPEDKPC
ncbi:MAG: hypothetical protein KGL39_37060 [Patescibacteria group bacterium]|nr:hypothetical protein [Patescibacteria group bacterium]